MKKLVSILKFPFHIIYLIGAYIFKAIKWVASFFVIILKKIGKGLKYFFSVIIPSIFKAIGKGLLKFFKFVINIFKKIGIYKVLKLVITYIIKGVKLFFIYLYKGIKLLIVYLYKVVKFIVVYLYKGIKLIITYIIKGIKAIVKGIIFGVKFIIKWLVKIVNWIINEIKIGAVFLYKETIILTKLTIKGLKWFIAKLIVVFKKIVNLLIKCGIFFINELVILGKNAYNGAVISFTYIGVHTYRFGKKAAIFLWKTAKKVPPYLKQLFGKAVYAFKNSGKEFTDIFRYAVLGVYLIFMGMFYDVPRMVVKAIPIIYKKSKESLHDWWLLRKQGIEEIPVRIKSAFDDKLNNNILVKSYRNKKLLQFENLTEMKIDKNSMDAVRSANKITFKYLVKNADGKFIKGYFSAFSKLDCHSYLLDEGYEVYKIETSKWIEFTHGESRFGNVVMAKKDLIFWLTQLSTYIKSGVPLTDATKILAAQDKRAKYKKVYDELIYELTMGESFARALEKQGRVFPPLLVNMVKAAEMMGDIEYTLDDMAAYYEDIESTKKEMKSAMTYPAIVGVFSLIIVVFILTYVIPQFEGIYDQAGIKMNGLTLFVLQASKFIKAKWWVILLILIAIVVTLIALYKNLKAFKTVTQYLLMHMPVIGKVMIYNEMVLFSKTFASLQKNNVLLTDSIDILSKITDNEIYKVIMLDTITNLLKGDKMSDSFKDNWAIPELAYYMISTGERTGDLASMLEKVSKYYQEQQKNMVSTLKAFIEPLMIAFLAIVVGGIIVAAILPMFSMYGSLM